MLEQCLWPGKKFSKAGHLLHVFSVHTVINLSFILPISTNVTHHLVQIRGNKARGKTLATRATLMTTLLELHCSSSQGRARTLQIIPIHLQEDTNLHKELCGNDLLGGSSSSPHNLQGSYRNNP